MQHGQFLPIAQTEEFTHMDTMHGMVPFSFQNMAKTWVAGRTMETGEIVLGDHAFPFILQLINFGTLEQIAQASTERITSVKPANIGAGCPLARDGYRNLIVRTDGGELFFAMKSDTRAEFFGAFVKKAYSEA